MLFKVFPCGTNKIPLIKDWQRLATKDPTQIQKWVNEFGSQIGSWGCPTGTINDIIVLDVDVKKSNGFETLKGLKVPETLSQPTPSGGRHYFYKYPNGGGVYGNRVNFMPSLDCRGEGGFVCYYGTDINVPIAHCPDWVLGATGKLSDLQAPAVTVRVDPSIATSAIHVSLENIRNAAPGESNNVLNTESFKVGQLVASGSIPRDVAEQALFAAAKERGKPDYEARATIKSGLDGGAKNPLTSPFSAPVIQIPIPAPPVIERWTPRQFTVSELMDRSKLKKPQLHEDWSTEDIAITTADGGVGKTTMKLFEAVCLALGEDFLGFPCVQRGKTLFITGEDTAAKLGAMLGAIVQQMGLLSDKVKLETVLSSIIVKKDADLCIIAKDKQGFLYANPTAMTRVLEAVQDIKPKLIVFDPISSFWGSESALNDMAKAVIKFMSRLAEESGACVEMINHMGKVSSANKDMTQFAGRGGTGLPSHARVSRVLRSVDEEEYKDLTGQDLADNVSAMLCNVNKFSDSSPLFNKPFLIVRQGYVFGRINLAPAKQREEAEKISDAERVFKYVAEMRKANKYPSKAVIVAHFMLLSDKVSESRIKRAIDLLTFNGWEDKKLAYVQGPDLTQKERVLIVTDHDGKEL